MRNIEFDKTAREWAYYGTLHSKFKLNLRHLFCNLDFAGLVDDAPLLEAVAFLQELLRQGKSPRQVKHADFPTGIFAKGVQRYMYTAAEKRKDKLLEVDRYECLVYRLLRNALEAGDVYVRDSNDFRSFEDDLIRAERWRDKDAVSCKALLSSERASCIENSAAFSFDERQVVNPDNHHIVMAVTGLHIHGHCLEAALSWAGGRRARLRHCSSHH